VGRELAKRTVSLEALHGLSDAEKKRLKHLQSELEQTGQQLDRAKTPKELLEELERRARDAEKLADLLRSEDLGALSTEMLSELERNADTSDLGAALREGDLGRMAEEARLLSARLGNRKLTLEEQQRLEEALKRALEAAKERDRKNPAAKSLEEARKRLAEGDRDGASRQFDELADRYGRAAQRAEVQKRLRDLARNFRGAGPRILGGKNLERLRPQSPNGAGQPLFGLPELAPGQSPQNLPQGRMLPLPMPGQGGATARLIRFVANRALGVFWER
jgi:hypothetical protein